MRSKCGKCSQCVTREMNQKLDGWKCLSYSFTTRIIEDILKYNYTLTDSQKEAMELTVETIKALDAALDGEPIA